MKKEQKCVIWVKVHFMSFCAKSTFMLLIPFLHKYSYFGGYCKKTTLKDNGTT
jgi:hypothetical protein